jgi:type I restriction enzyme, S subunit
MTLPVGWRLFTPHEIAGEDKTRLIIGPFGSDLKTSDYRSEGVPLVFVRDIREGGFKSPRKFIDSAKADKLRSHMTIPGDILITKMGEPPGDAAVYTAARPAVITADCIRLRPIDGFDARFIAFAIQAPVVKRQIELITSGIAQRKVSLARFRSGISIPVPPHEEQRRIVDLLEDHVSRLDAADAYLAGARRRLISMERSAIDKLFGGTEIPLAELIDDISAGKSFGGANAAARDDEWGIIKVSAMTWGAFDPAENKAVPPERVDPRFEIQEGDLLLSRANTEDYVGASVVVGQVRPKLLLSDKSLRITPRAGVRADWLWRALQAPSARRQISMLATGTKESMRNISQDSLKRVRLPIANGERQASTVSEFAEIAAVVVRMRSAIVGAERRSRALRRSLLAAAFSGWLTSYVVPGLHMEAGE